MPKEWSDEEVKSEIADAIRIVREDRFEAFVRGRVAPTNDDKNGTSDKSGDGGNSNQGDGSGKPKKGLWWGESE